MEQLSIRDWMILIGGMMIAAVLIDAVRRYWRERRAEIKLNARIERASPLSDDDDAFNLLTELPNGGARIVHRDDLQIDPKATAPISEAPAAVRDRADSTPRNAPAPDPIDVAAATSIGSGAGAFRGVESARSRTAAGASDIGAVAFGSICRSSLCTIRAPPLGNSVNKLKASSSSDSGEARSMRAFSLISARRSRQ